MPLKKFAKFAWVSWAQSVYIRALLWGDTWGGRTNCSYPKTETSEINAEVIPCQGIPGTNALPCES